MVELEHDCISLRNEVGCRLIVQVDAFQVCHCRPGTWQFASIKLDSQFWSFLAFVLTNVFFLQI